MGVFTSVVDVGHCAGNRSGSGNTSEQKGATMLAAPLCDKFRVGVVAVADHTVRYGGG